MSLPLKYLFRYPTPAELARMIKALQVTAGNADISAADEDREEFDL